jgi:hypothetical protein
MIIDLSAFGREWNWQDEEVHIVVRGAKAVLLGEAKGSEHSVREGFTWEFRQDATHGQGVLHDSSALTRIFCRSRARNGVISPKRGGVPPCSRRCAIASGVPFPTVPGVGKR